MNTTTIKFRNFLVKFKEKLSTMPASDQMPSFSNDLQSYINDIDWYEENIYNIKRIFILQLIVKYVNSLKLDQQTILFDMMNDYLLRDPEIILEFEQVLYNSCIEIKHDGINETLNFQNIKDKKQEFILLDRSLSKALLALRNFTSSITSVDNMYDLNNGLVEFYQLRLKEENHIILIAKLETTLINIIEKLSKIDFKNPDERGAQILLCNKYEQIIQELSSILSLNSSESKLNLPEKHTNITVSAPQVEERKSNLENSSINFSTFFKKLLNQNPKPVQTQNLIESKKL